MENKGNQPGGLRAVFTPLGMWSFSIGTSIGWGSFIVTCNTYLQKSGVLGTVLGLVLGMAVILIITWNLQYMICNTPDAGGVYTFEKQIFGKDMGFLSMWFVLLTYSAILWANMTSVPLFIRFFLGDTFRFGFHYHIFGYEVWLGEALLSMTAVVIIGILCTRSSRIINRLMILAAISPWAFIGFENISHFSEEYTFPVKRIRRILIWSVLLSTLLYIFVSLLSVSAYPPEYESWLAYIHDMGSLQGIKAVPAFYAAWYYLGEKGVAVLMLALFGVILTSLIGNLLALSRLLYAAGREGEAPRVLSGLNEKGIPAKAIYFIIAVSVLIPFLGRTAIGWIVDVTTLGATLIYGMLSLGVLFHARRAGNRTEKYTGAAGFLIMALFLLLILVPGLLPFHAMETESYVLFTAVSLVLFLLFAGIIMHNYMDTRRLGKRLFAAEEAVKAAEKIAELTESISTLLDNMPALTYSKDAATGVYLACN